MNILIAEDDLDLVRLLVQVLTEDGHRVQHAETGSEAIANALVTDYHLLICDLMLPDLKGTELIRALKAQSPRLPVLVISALDARDWEPRCIDAGAAYFLQKPLSIKELREQISMVDAARVGLNIALIEPDTIHAAYLTKSLNDVGATVSPFPSAITFKSSATNNPHINLLLVSATLDDVEETTRWANKQNITTFVIVDGQHPVDEDGLMRAGAAFFLKKPVNIDGFIAQARFLGAGDPFARSA